MTLGREAPMRPFPNVESSKTASSLWGWFDALLSGYNASKNLNKKMGVAEKNNVLRRIIPTIYRTSSCITV